MGYFRQQQFSYTLRPELMQDNPIDQFLFDYQAGFCAHFASAMTYALRLGGVPARMVTGYQGGEERENNYLSVYQYDAHAWVEAWLDDRGWVRFDPTAVVSPDRIQYGLERAVAEEGSFLEDSPFSLARLRGIEWINSVRLLLADLDYQWSRWVLGFNRSQQENLLKKILGQVNTTTLIYLSVTTFLVFMLILALYFLPNWSRTKLRPTEKHYNKALNLLARKGVLRPKSMGPKDFAYWVSEHISTEASIQFRRLSDCYIALKYRDSSTPDAKLSAQMLKDFKKALARG